MCQEYLGSEFDIHAGGMDLIFPHHENETAQANACGDEFARFWLHNGWVTMGGEKMSKSLGNVLAIPAVLQRVRAAELRYYLGSAHYRSMLEFSETALADALTPLCAILPLPEWCATLRRLTANNDTMSQPTAAKVPRWKADEPLSWDPLRPASMALGASTVTLLSSGGESPMAGSKMWWCLWSGVKALRLSAEVATARPSLCSAASSRCSSRSTAARSRSTRCARAPG